MVEEVGHEDPVDNGSPQQAKQGKGNANIAAGPTKIMVAHVCEF